VLSLVAAVLLVLPMACENVVGIEDVAYVEAGSTASVCGGTRYAVCSGKGAAEFGTKCSADKCDCKAGTACVLTFGTTGACCNLESLRCGAPGDACKSQCDCATGTCSDSKCK